MSVRLRRTVGLGEEGGVAAGGPEGEGVEGAGLDCDTVGMLMLHGDCRLGWNAGATLWRSASGEMVGGPALMKEHEGWG